MFCGCVCEWATTMHVYICDMCMGFGVSPFSLPMYLFVWKSSAYISGSAKKPLSESGGGGGVSCVVFWFVFGFRVANLIAPATFVSTTGSLFHWPLFTISWVSCPSNLIWSAFAIVGESTHPPGLKMVSTERSDHRLDRHEKEECIFSESFSSKRHVLMVLNPLRTASQVTVISLQPTFLFSILEVSPSCDYPSPPCCWRSDLRIPSLLPFRSRIPSTKRKARRRCRSTCEVCLGFGHGRNFRGSFPAIDT